MPSDNIPSAVKDEETLTKIASYLYDELEQSRRDRQEYVEEWKEIHELYEKVELEEKRDFPWPNAACIMVPVIPSNVEKVVARIHRTLFTPKDMYQMEALNGRLDDHARAARRFSTWSVRHDLKLKRTARPLLIELAMLGTCVAKTLYEREYETIYYWDEVREARLPLPTMVKDGVTTVAVPLADFFFPMHCRTWDEIYWKSHRLRMRWSEIQKRVEWGRFDKKQVEKIKNYDSQKDSDLFETLERLDGVSGTRHTDSYYYDIHEIWFDFDVNGDGIRERFRAYFHPDSKTILRIWDNDYPLQGDPFSFCPYVERLHRVLGIGIGKMGIAVQKEVSTMHNQRLDNATIVNVVGYKYKADSSIGPDLPLRVGGGVPVDEMEDFDPFQWGQKYDSTIDAEQHTLQLFYDRIGVQDAEFLIKSQATNVVAAMQEMAGKSDLVIDNVREFFADIMQKAMLLYQQYYPRERIAEIIGPDDAALVEELFSLPSQLLAKGIGASVTATQSSTSRETERQSKLALFNLITQYYGQTVQYFIQSQSPELPPQIKVALLTVVDGLSEFVLEILDDFNIRNREEFVITLERIRQAAAEQIPEAAAQSPNGVPGMGAVPFGPPPGGGNGAPAPDGVQRPRRGVGAPAVRQGY